MAAEADEMWSAALSQHIVPGSTLLRRWELPGGVSAQMSVLKIRRPDDEIVQVIARRPGARVLARNPQAAADEYRILQVVQAAGVRAPAPLFVDPSGALCGTPCLVMEHIGGNPDYAPADVDRFARQVAGQLAAIHSITASTADLPELPNHGERLAAALTYRPPQPDESLQEGRIRQTLAAAWPWPQRNATALLHGDFWPGNLLWHDGELVAVVDWEDAAVGDPLADLAISRLDMLWMLGIDAMQRFTQYYEKAAPIDFTALPYWDLAAALRPAGHLAAWAAWWPELGRPDVDETTMRAGHRLFVEQAYARLDSGHKGG